uniref:F-box protein n=1 Tax=Heterorhabditis bacteriophora TaxID=37862 RepID=A0A1I7XSE1_HETBA
MWRMLDKCPNIVLSWMKKCPQLTQGHKDERLHWARILMRCDWKKVLASLSNKIMPQSTPVEAPRNGWKTMMWPLWTGRRALRT